MRNIIDLPGRPGFNNSLDSVNYKQWWTPCDDLAAEQPEVSNKGTSYRPISILSVIADTGEDPSSLHNSKHARHTHVTRVQKKHYSDGTTHIKQHSSKGVQSNGSTCTNNHCGTQYEQSFRHNKHSHTNQRAAVDKHSVHHCCCVYPLP